MQPSGFAQTIVVSGVSGVVVNTGRVVDVSGLVGGLQPPGVPHTVLTSMVVESGVVKSRVVDSSGCSVVVGQATVFFWMLLSMSQ